MLLLVAVAGTLLAGCTANDDPAAPTPVTNETNMTPTPTPTPEPECVAPAPAPCVEPPAEG